MMRSRRARATASAVSVLLLMRLALPGLAYPRPGRTERVSVASDGTQANGGSSAPEITPDGRYVVFYSSAPDLVPGITNDAIDVFVHDRETGETERVSVASDGTEGDGHSRYAVISADGRYVVFYSEASNLVPGDTNGTWDVFVHDRETGVTERVSVSSEGTQANGGSAPPEITPDGRYVAFQSTASNLVPGDVNGEEDIFVHDRETGVTERVSVSSDGTQGNERSWGPPGVSDDGRYVSFYSYATNLVSGDTNGDWDAFVHDRETGETERVSVASDGTQGDGFSAVPQLSADGRYVVFYGDASNLVPGDTNDVLDVFVHDRATGETERVSVASDGTEGNEWSFSFPSPFTPDGRYVVFYSEASNLVPGDTNDAMDVFVHDRAIGTTERVSLASDGTEADSRSLYSAISADGRHVAFYSYASNLVPGDTNDASDIFVRDRGPTTGVGSLEARKAGNEVTVSGWATFSGRTVASADDPGDDGGEIGPLSARDLGAEITGASATYRSEEDDLLLRLRLASLPEGGLPAVLYQWSFTVGETAHEVRVMRAAATASPPAAPYFALYECAPSCTESTRLSGGIGTAGAEVRAAVSLEALGAEQGATLTDVEASAAVGEAAPGALEILDDVALPDASIPIPRVELGIAPPSAPEADVTFSAQADLIEGRFSGTLDVSSLPPDPYRVWARACLGETCGAASRSLTLG